MLIAHRTGRALTQKARKKKENINVCKIAGEEKNEQRERQRQADETEAGTSSQGRQETGRTRSDLTFSCLSHH